MNTTEYTTLDQNHFKQEIERWTILCLKQDEALIWYIKIIAYNFFLSDPPENVKITPGNDTFYIKKGVKPLHDITCEADCQPECTYTWYTEGLSSYETGNNLFAKRSIYQIGSYRFLCRASNYIRSNDSRWITVEVKGRIVCVPICSILS